MPFDGVVTKAVVEELKSKLISGRINKISQPHRDEVILQIRANSKNYRILCSANPSSARVHITSAAYKNPLKAPPFCMLLRKHLCGGIIKDFEFCNFERIISIKIESTDELGDKNIKRLVIEIMGRHSNIILLNSDGFILDCIKHIDHDINRFREIMPARPYIAPPAQNKKSPAEIYKKGIDLNKNRDISVSKFLLTEIKGFSPILCREICYIAGIDQDISLASLKDENKHVLLGSLYTQIQKVIDSHFSPCIVCDNSRQKMIDYHCIKISQYEKIIPFSSISEAIDTFYLEKDHSMRLKQKISELTKILNNNITRCEKKLAIHEKTLREAARADKYKLYGELITANIYRIPKGASKVSLENYYESGNLKIDIPLDKNKSASENAQRYFNRYRKMKAAFKHARKQILEAQKELEYLESVLLLLNNCDNTAEINEIRNELIEEGYIKIKNDFKKHRKAIDTASDPVSFRSNEGFEILVGKNNKQNDYLTTKLANSTDIWLHTKNIPGSHVIIRTSGRKVPDATLLQAAQLAAWHSKGRQSSKVEVDFTEVKNVKKPAKAKPGMVIYKNYKTIIVEPKLIDK